MINFQDHVHRALHEAASMGHADVASGLLMAGDGTVLSGLEYGQLLEVAILGKKVRDGIKSKMCMLIQEEMTL